jgi:hypothetical protein
MVEWKIRWLRILGVAYREGLWDWKDQGKTWVFFWVWVGVMGLPCKVWRFWKGICEGGMICLKNVSQRISKRDVESGMCLR